MKFLLIILALIAILVFALGFYRIFEKANEKGWKAFIPFYNVVVLLKIVKKPWWFVFFLAVPIIGDLFFPYVFIQLYRNFGIKGFWKLLLAITLSFIYVPIVGFSKKYNFTQSADEVYNIGRDLRIWSYAIIFLLFSVLFAEGIHLFLFQNYSLPTASMENTLLVGDYIIVDKLSVGPRLPMTPLSLPIYKHTIPVLGWPSFIASIQLPYHRLSDAPKITRNNIIVYNYPLGDTVVIERSNENYYTIIREYKNRIRQFDNTISEEYLDILARKAVHEKYTLVYRPTDKREHYSGRCIALPGDSIKIENGKLIVNNIEVDFPKLKHLYKIESNAHRFTRKELSKIGLNEDEVYYSPDASFIFVNLSINQLNALKSIRVFKCFEKVNESYNAGNRINMEIFPHSKSYKWTRDNYGTIHIPQKGTTINLSLSNLALYERIISVYEKNKLEVKDGYIYINNKLCDTYTFKMNYYWVMGDNRHNSVDSRYWGFLPEDHVIGKAAFIFYSWSNALSIRWDRFLTRID